jgi:hypothetical protein
MAWYELKVFEDGDCAVRKVLEQTKFRSNLLFSSRKELQEYLITELCTRWPINEVFDAIESAKDDEWTEFK